jgi:hypothetical protein
MRRAPSTASNPPASLFYLRRGTKIVGQTANLLLELDEAQDIQIQKYDKDLVNMVASTNATRVF